MKQPRVRVERVIGRTDGAKLTIDHLTFYLERPDVLSLAEQLLRVLRTETKETTT